MKKLLVLSLIAAGASFGTSLKQADIRLQLAVTSVMEFHYLPVGQREATLITVDSFGDVVGARCMEKSNPMLGVGRPYYFNCNHLANVKHLSAREQRAMEVLIQQARYGEIQYPNPGAISCMAMPTRSDRYTADNGSVLLSTGTHPCGSVVFNSSRAAIKLVETLNKYERLYSTLHLVD